MRFGLAGVPQMTRMTVFGVLLCLCAQPVFAAQRGGETLGAARPAPTLEAMEKELAKYQDVAAEDAAGTRLREAYTNAVQALRDAAVQREEQAHFERRLADAPGRKAQAEAELAALQRAGARSRGRITDVTRLERLLDTERARLDDAREQESVLTETLASLQVRTDRARQELKTQTGDRDANVPPSARSKESVALTNARMDEWRAGQELRAATRSRLETEIRSLPARIVAVQAQLKLASAQREAAERTVSELLDLEHLRRIATSEALRDEVGARAAEAAAIPALAQLAAQTNELAAEYVRIVKASESRGDELAAAAAALAELRASYESTRQQVEAANLDRALGPVLAEHYRNLLEVEGSASRRVTLSTDLSDARLGELRVKELQQGADRLREQVDLDLRQEPPVDNREQRRRADIADALLADRDTLIGHLDESYLKVAAQILELEDIYGQQDETAERFLDLLHRNLVWMRSHAPLGLLDFLAWPIVTWKLAISQDWPAFVASVRASLSPGKLSVLALLTLAFVVISRRLRFRKMLRQLGLSDCGWEHYEFSSALKALGVHLLRSLPLPLLLFWFAWALEGSGDRLAQAVSLASRNTAVMLYSLIFLLEVMGPDGLGHAHLRWRAARVRAVARWLRWMVILVPPIAFVSLVLREIASDGSAIASRTAALVLSVTFLALAIRIVRAGRGMFDSAFFKEGYPRLGRLINAFMVVVLGMQVLAVVMDLQGYHYTSSALQIRAFLSLLIVVLARLLADVGLLGLAVVARRSHAVRAEEVAEAEVAGVGTETDSDLDQMSRSAVAMLHIVVFGCAILALGALWGQFFSALSVLDTVELWNYESTVDGKSVQLAVSVFDLFGALAVLGLSAMLSKAFPAFLGLVLYGVVTRKGVLFAIQTVISYVIAVMGFVLSLQMLGFGWAKLQWMAAGLSVGLGFGMQEIFANFFAGLIMLFERPVRIGDIVTLGEYSGTIHKIRIRATTITDFDNREIIVPNKMFVTERLINWTLSSSVVRVSFDVGVSYDSDPVMVRETLMAILAGDPRVLKEPAPSVVFQAFGASTLDFRCFAHVEDVSLRMPLLNDMHLRIVEVFREKAIEIAYPQMDLHLRSVSPAVRSALGGGAV